jgi:DNA-binding CsgD family transcriptional regulator
MMRGFGGSNRLSSVSLLDHFGIPSARFDRTGRLVGISPAISEVYDRSDDVVAHATRLARELLVEGRDRVPPDAVVAAPGLDGRTILRAQFLPPGDDAEVIVLVLAAGRDRLRSLNRLAGLSQRETEVAVAIASGASTKEIAGRLGISIHTARRHTERVFAKLGVRSRAQVVMMLHDGGGHSMVS